MRGRPAQSLAELRHTEPRVTWLGASDSAREPALRIGRRVVESGCHSMIQAEPAVCQPASRVPVSAARPTCHGSAPLSASDSGNSL
eukprot:1502558-Rhodomonas_salina.4